jgi:hypothetical protein
MGLLTASLEFLQAALHAPHLALLAGIGGTDPGHCVIPFRIRCVRLFCVDWT